VSNDQEEEKNSGTLDDLLHHVWRWNMLCGSDFVLVDKDNLRSEFLSSVTISLLVRVLCGDL
jgi:hypothetical protein